jgi:ADP-glucose pyrophosphorylase
VRDKPKLTLFDIPEKPLEHECEWVDMPEFVQDKKEPFMKIIVRFESEQDLKDFSKLIGQKLTKKTKSIWFPFKSHWGGIKKVWIDEE